MVKVKKTTFNSIVDFTPKYWERRGDETYFYRRRDSQFFALISREELNGRLNKTYFLEVN